MHICTCYVKHATWHLQIHSPLLSQVVIRPNCFTRAACCSGSSSMKTQSHALEVFEHCHFGHWLYTDVTPMLSNSSARVETFSCTHKYRVCAWRAWPRPWRCAVPRAAEESDRTLSPTFSPQSSIIACSDTPMDPARTIA